MDEIAPADYVENESTDSKDGTCEYCGKHVPYPGKGPRPRYCNDHKRKSARNGNDNDERPQTANPPAVGGDVGAACASLATLYDLMAAGLYFVSPAAASEWAQRTPALLAQDQRILRADPKLAKRLAGVGASGGTVALIGVHLAALVPVATIVYAEKANAAPKRPAPQVRQEPPAPEPSAPATPRDMGAFFGVEPEPIPDPNEPVIPASAARFFG